MCARAKDDDLLKGAFSPQRVLVSICGSVVRAYASDFAKNDMYDNA